MGTLSTRIFEHIVDRTLPILRSYRASINELAVHKKSDKTLLTQADIDVQENVIACIERFDPGVNVVAEEDKDTSPLQPNIKKQTLERSWIIDPIDGTSQFVNPASNEFCTSVTLIEEGVPTATLVLAPELGRDREPVIVMAAADRGSILVNGQFVDHSSLSWREYRASTTRSEGAKSSGVERYLSNSGYELKTRTTSQVLDLLRTAVHTKALSSGGEDFFDLFYRADQKIWDGASGLCLARILGLETVDLSGNSLLPLSPSFLSQREPILSHSLIGTEGLVKKLVAALNGK